MHPNNNKNIIHLLSTILLIILPISSSLCIDMYLPAYSSIAKGFHVGEGAINLSMSCYLVGLAVGQLIYGPYSDRFGRKITLLIGLCFFALASLLCMVSQNLTIFLIARVLQALGACSSIVLTRAIVTDSYHPEKRTAVLALISATNIFSPAIAPLLGGYILQFSNWRFIFFVIAVFATLMLLGVWRLLHETLAEADPDALRLRRMTQNFIRLSKNRRYVGYVLCLAALYALVFVWVTYSPGILMDHFGISADNFGLYFVMPATGSMLGAIVTAKFSAKIRVQQFIQAGLSFILTIILLLLILQHYHLIRSPMIITGIIVCVFFGTGMTGPALVSGALSQFADVVGFASGIMGFIQTISGALIGMCTSFLYSNSIQRLPIFMLLLISIAICCFLYATFHRKGGYLVVVTRKREVIRKLRKLRALRKTRMHKGFVA